MQPHVPQVETLVVGQLQTNCYLIYDPSTKDCVIIDPGDDIEFIQNKINDLGIIPKLIIATHGHFDHVLGVVDLQLHYQIPFFIHKNDVFLLKRMPQTAAYFLKTPITTPVPIPNVLIKDNQTVNGGSLRFEVILTPGHTPGSISLYFTFGQYLFSGDTWFADGGIGRTDFPYACAVDLQTSIRLLLELPPQTRLLSGHGKPSTIEEEARAIFFLKGNWV